MRRRRASIRKRERETSSYYDYDYDYDDDHHHHNDKDHNHGTASTDIQRTPTRILLKFTKHSNFPRKTQGVHTTIPPSLSFIYASTQIFLGWSRRAWSVPTITNCESGRPSRRPYVTPSDLTQSVAYTHIRIFRATGEVLEIGAFWSIRTKDIPSFDRYFSQLQIFYNDYR